MASLVIKELPDELYTLLKESAHRNHRSMVRQAVALLEASLKETRVGQSSDFVDIIAALGGSDPDAAAGPRKRAFPATGR